MTTGLSITGLFWRKQISAETLIDRNKNGYIKVINVLLSLPSLNTCKINLPLSSWQTQFLFLHHQTTTCSNIIHFSSLNKCLSLKDLPQSIHLYSQTLFLFQKNLGRPSLKLFYAWLNGETKTTLSCGRAQRLWEIKTKIWIFEQLTIEPECTEVNKWSAKPEETQMTGQMRVYQEQPVFLWPAMQSDVTYCARPSHGNRSLGKALKHPVTLQSKMHS